MHSGSLTFPVVPPAHRSSKQPAVALFNLLHKWKVIRSWSGFLNDGGKTFTLHILFYVEKL